MANPRHNAQVGHARPSAGPDTARRTGAGSPAMREKPAFGKMGLPGKGGPDRSAGVTKCKCHVAKEGFA